MSLVPPTFLQSRKTVRPVLALYQSRNPTVNSWRIASLWGLMMTSVSSACCGDGCRGRRMNGIATVATRARMMIPRFSIGQASARQDDNVLGTDARVELTGALPVDEPGVELQDLERDPARLEVVLRVLAEVGRPADAPPDRVLRRAFARDRPALGPH